MDASADAGGDRGKTRVTLKEAARLLGVSPEAVRKRVQRKTLKSEKGADGRVYVYLDATTDAGGDEAGRVEGDELVEVLREQVSYLREQLDQERSARTEERRRHDTIVAQLTSRIPELEPPRGGNRPQDGRGDGPTGPEGSESGGTPPDDPGHRTDDPRPWWRRVFGG